MVSILLSILLFRSAPDVDIAQSLVATERLFCQTAAASGTRDAFLQFIADNGVLFRPGPVIGKEWLAKSPPSPGLLEWSPAQAEASSGGDFGYTTGPYTYRKSAREKAAAFGCYVTVWQKQADGSWKFLVDAGSSNPQPQEKAVRVRFVSTRRLDEQDRSDAGSARLLRADREFAQACALRGIGRAYSENAAEDILVYRPGIFPSSGTTAMVKLVEARPGSLTWSPSRAEAARHGDLGFTYGVAEFRPADGVAERSNYLRVWRMSNGRWKIIIDLLMAPN